MNRKTKGSKKKDEAEPIQERPDPNILAEALGDEGLNYAGGRLSISGRKRSLFRADDSEDKDLESYNVEEEKEERRKEEEAEIKASKKKAATATVQSRFGVLNTLSAEEIENHYSTCIQMCSQNKVSSKNAFKLQLIDYMKMILIKRSTKSENLSLMSCTLDASAKIYSYRVDKVYNDMLKLVSFKGGKPSHDDDDEDNDDGSRPKSGDEEECQLAKKKKKKKGNRGDEEDEENRTEADDYLLNDIKMLQAWQKILGDEKSFQKSKIEEEVYTETLPRGLDYFLECPLSGVDFKLTLDGPLIEKTTLRPPESSIAWSPFNMDDWGDDMDLESIIPGYDELKGKFDMFDNNEETVNLPSCHESNAYFPSVDLSDHVIEDGQDCSDDDIGPCFDDDVQNVVNEPTLSVDDAGLLLAAVGTASTFHTTEELPILRHSTLPSLQIELEPQSSSQQNSQTPSSAQLLLTTSAVFDDRVLKNSRFNFWGGPKHWKRRPLPPAPRCGGRMTEKKAKKDKSLRFTDTEEVFSCSKKILNSTHLESEAPKLSKRTITTWREKSNVFPPEVENLQLDLFSFFNCKSISMVRIKGSENTDESKTVGNEPDTLVRTDNFGANTIEANGDCDADDRNAGGTCSDNDDYGHEENDRDISLFDKSVDMFDQSNHSQNLTHIDEKALIPVPHKVDQIKVKYCKVQKRIDIKLVKQTLWGLICLENNKENECNQIKEPKPHPPAKRKSEDSNSGAKNGKRVNFSNLFDSLKCDLPEETSQELSFPIAFMSLLHLANEKNLSLEGNENYDDVNVSVNT